MRIIGPPSTDLDTTRTALTAVGGNERFTTDMLAPLWAAGLRYGIDPVGLTAQAWKETAGGAYTGRVTPQHYNPCGLKVRHPGYGGPATDGDQPLAHAAFASWDVGATAHAQHVRAYTGWPIDGELIVDPRYWLVIGRHRCENWADLGGRWAPSATYGTEVEQIMTRLQGPTR